MEALVYDDSPLAGYLESDAIPLERPTNRPSNPPQFAPRGFPELHRSLDAIRRTAKSVTHLADQEFYERFRYRIIASQLLSDDLKPRGRSIPDIDHDAPSTFTTRGVCVTAGLSFTAAWFLNGLRQRIHTFSSATWLTVFTQLLLFSLFLGVLAIIARRQYLKFLRGSASVTLSDFLHEAHEIDHTATAALRYIQEVEVVARGYDLSHPLPPVSRLEDSGATRRCRLVRSTASANLKSIITQLTQTHELLLSWVNERDLERYHHVYEISTAEYVEALKLADGTSCKVDPSLKDLRFLFGLLVLARKLVLVDLLAIRARSTWPEILQFRSIIHTVQLFLQESTRARHMIRESLVQEEERVQTLSSKPIQENESSNDELTWEAKHTQAQLRRFDAVATGVRSLYAKVRMYNEDLAEMSSVSPSANELSATIGRHYDDIGSELRSILVEWERGRNTIYLNMDTNNRFSMPSNGVRSSISSSPSLGGFTVVDGGPAEALKLLTGEDDPQSSYEQSAYEEVFEAVAQPRKRMSVALSREEKMAKLHEDRRKRATLQEQADTTTNMLRELQMVIKHRPEARSPSRTIPE